MNDLDLPDTVSLLVWAVIGLLVLLGLIIVLARVLSIDKLLVIGFWWPTLLAAC